MQKEKLGRGIRHVIKFERVIAMFYTTGYNN